MTPDRIVTITIHGEPIRVDAEVFSALLNAAGFGLRRIEREAFAEFPPQMRRALTTVGVLRNAIEAG